MTRRRSEAEKAAEPLCTAEQAAALTFEPWPNPAELPTNAEMMAFWDEVMPSLRIAWLLVQKTKPELVAVMRGAGLDAHDALQTDWSRSKEAAQGVLELVQCVEARALSALAVVALENEAGGMK